MESMLKKLFNGTSTFDPKARLEAWEKDPEYRKQLDDVISDSEGRSMTLREILLAEARIKELGEEIRRLERENAKLERGIVDLERYIEDERESDRAAKESEDAANREIAEKKDEMEKAAKEYEDAVREQAEKEAGEKDKGTNDRDQPTAEGTGWHTPAGNPGLAAAAITAAAIIAALGLAAALNWANNRRDETERLGREWDEKDDLAYDIIAAAKGGVVTPGNVDFYSKSQLANKLGTTVEDYHNRVKAQMKSHPDIKAAMKRLRTKNPDFTWDSQDNIWIKNPQTKKIAPTGVPISTFPKK